MNLIKIAKLSDIKDQTPFEVIVNTKSVILIKDNGTVRAFQGNCPHKGTPLIEGHIENGQLICPMHHWKFSCETGQRIQERECLEQYDLTIKNDKLFIDQDLFKNEKASSSKKLKTIADLPSPKGQFLLGNWREFNKVNRHQVLERWAAEIGDLFKINLGGKKFIVSTDPDFFKQVLKARPDKFIRLRQLAEVIEEMSFVGVFNAEGEVWKKHRKFTSEALNMKNTKNFFPIIAEMTEQLLDRLKQHSFDKQRIDIHSEMMLYSVNIISRIAFGRPLENDLKNHLKKIMPMIGERLSAPFPIWRYIKFKKDKELDKAIVAVKKTLYRFIEDTKKLLQQHPERKENPQNFLEALVVEQEKDKNITDYDIYGNIFTMLLAGEDTTSNSLAWAVYYLAQHPEAVSKIRAESEVIYNGAFPTEFAAIPKLSYTEAAAMEAMRLRTVIPSLFLQANEDIEVKGLFIKKDTPLILQIKIPQVDEQHFFQPNSFIPERWLKTGCPMSGARAHNPDVLTIFGGGPRYCPGKNLAMYEMVSALSMICKNFDLSMAVDPKDVKEVFALAMQPDNLFIRCEQLKTKVVG